MGIPSRGYRKISDQAAPIPPCKIMASTCCATISLEGDLERLKISVRSDGRSQFAGVGNDAKRSLLEAVQSNIRATECIRSPKFTMQVIAITQFCRLPNKPVRGIK
jgi:hypothetical protein